MLDLGVVIDFKADSKSIDAALDGIDRSVLKIKNSIQGITNDIRYGATEAFRGLGGEVFSTATKMAAITGAVYLLGSGVRELGRHLRETVKELNSFADISQKLNMSMAQFQTLQFAAERADIGYSTLRQMVTMLQAWIGSGKATPHLRALGLDPTKVANENGFRQFIEVNKAINTQVPLYSDQQAMRLAMGGRGMLQAGSIELDQVEKFETRLRKLGLLVSEVAKGAIENFNDNLEFTNRIFSGLSDQIVVDIAPAFDSLTDKVLKFVENMGGVGNLAQALSRPVKFTIEFISSGLDAYGSVVNKLTNTIESTASHMEGIRTGNYRDRGLILGTIDNLWRAGVMGIDWAGSRIESLTPNSLDKINSSAKYANNISSMGSSLSPIQAQLAVMKKEFGDITKPMKVPAELLASSMIESRMAVSKAFKAVTTSATKLAEENGKIAIPFKEAQSALTGFVAKMNDAGNNMFSTLLRGSGMSDLTKEIFNKSDYAGTSTGATEQFKHDASQVLGLIRANAPVERVSIALQQLKRRAELDQGSTVIAGYDRVMGSTVELYRAKTIDELGKLPYNVHQVKVGDLTSQPKYTPRFRTLDNVNELAIVEELEKFAAQQNTKAREVILRVTPSKYAFIEFLNTPEGIRIINQAIKQKMLVDSGPFSTGQGIATDYGDDSSTGMGY